MANEIRYQSNPDVSFRDEGDEGAVLYNPDLDLSTIMNTTGGLIWGFIEKPRTLDEIAAFLVETFSGVSLENARTDAENFINMLGENFINEIP
jgi:hypothetical protein